MGEFVEIGAGGVSLELISGVFCATALGVYALFQPDASDDDDSNGGTTFQAILNETRESLALHYLANPSLSANEIAYLLGYEEPSSFYRAFQAWTGETPQAVRASLS